MQIQSGMVAVITGAGSGLGRAFAIRAAQLGMRLVLADIDDAAVQETRRLAAAHGTAAFAMRVDVARAADVQALARETSAAFGVPHLVFNNAGVGFGGLLWEQSLSDWSWMLGVNLWGVIHGIHAFVPSMLAEADRCRDYQGYIVNTASMAGLVNMPLLGAYNASKHAVVALTETLHHDLRLSGCRIGCSVLCPYFTPTRIHDSERNRPVEMANETPPTLSQLAIRELLEQAVARSKVTADQVAALTFEAVRENRFYIHSHPHALEGVRMRTEAVLSSALSPDDPLSTRSGLRERLQLALAK